MKVTYKIIIALMLTLSACIGLKRVHRLIDQKEEFIWTGSDGAKSYLLTIDNADGIWFAGKIIIDSQDTLYLKGFEKGSNHPTTVTQSADDSINNASLGLIFIWTKGYMAETIRMDNKHDSIPQLPIQLILLKTQKTTKNDFNKRH
jgi:hypothetical protein